ncbi:glycosyltransferase [Flavobacterium sp. 3HN19-14]|uniref:glycosyltransferase n=1 Tax=Flavobacterium sp. 3HN19-14 TaxID=3448133 RepID=UPI003EE09B26
MRVSAGRKEVFERALKSLHEQTYQNINLFISYDDDSCKEFIPEYCFSIKVEPNHSLGQFFYNDYCNVLKSEIETVDNRWFFFLDCDDYIAQKNSIEEIVKDLRGNAWQAVVCQMSRDNGKIKPSNELISAKKVESGRIGLPCLILRAQYKDSLKVGVTENSDYEWIKAITDSVATKFVKKVLVHSPKRSYGK